MEGLRAFSPGASALANFALARRAEVRARIHHHPTPCLPACLLRPAARASLRPQCPHAHARCLRGCSAAAPRSPPSNPPARPPLPPSHLTIPSTPSTPPPTHTQVWHHLEWQGRHSQAPVAVAARTHYFCELDVGRTVDNLVQ